MKQSYKLPTQQTHVVWAEHFQHRNETDIQHGIQIKTIKTGNELLKVLITLLIRLNNCTEPKRKKKKKQKEIKR